MLKYRKTVLGLGAVALLLVLALAGMYTKPAVRPVNDWLLERQHSYFEFFRDVTFWEGNYALLVRDGERMHVVDESFNAYWISAITPDAVLIGVQDPRPIDLDVPASIGINLAFHILRRGDRKLRPIQGGNCPSAIADSGQILCIRCDDPAALETHWCRRVTISRLDVDMAIKAQQSWALPDLPGHCTLLDLRAGEPAISGVSEGAPVVRGSCLVVRKAKDGSADDMSFKDILIRLGPSAVVICKPIARALCGVTAPP